MKNINNKIKNATKRFRQGRISYKKLKDMFNEELSKHMNDLKLLGEKLQEVKNAVGHVHDENCHHDDEVVVEEHVHDEHCDHK